MKSTGGIDTAEQSAAGKVVPYQLVPGVNPANRLHDAVGHYEAIVQICSEVQTGSIDCYDAASKISDITDIFCNAREEDLLRDVPSSTRDIVILKSSLRDYESFCNTYEAIMQEQQQRLKLYFETIKTLREFLVSKQLMDEFLQICGSDIDLAPDNPEQSNVVSFRARKNDMQN